MHQRSNPQIAARMVDRLQSFQRHTSDIAEYSRALIGAMYGSSADAFHERLKCVLIVDDDWRGGMFMLDSVQKGIIRTRQYDRSDALAEALPLPLGTNEKPSSRAVDTLEA